MEEIWKQIKGTSGRYLISNMGRFKRSKHKLIDTKGRIYHRDEKIIKPSINNSGYQSVTYGTGKNESIHRLVALHFVKGYKDGLNVNHKDFNKNNNIYSNLEWVTKSQNSSHSAIFQPHYKRKLGSIQVLEILGHLKQGKSCLEISKIYNVSLSAISSIKTGRSWSYITKLKN